MRRKRIALLLSVIAVVMLLCTGVLADGTRNWTQKANHSDVDVTYYGRVDWKDKGYAPNILTYYARLAGSEKNLFIDSNAATLLIRSGRNNVILSLKIYDGNEYPTDQKQTLATWIKVNWTFDGYDNYYELK